MLETIWKAKTKRNTWNFEAKTEEKYTLSGTDGLTFCSKFTKIYQNEAFKLVA